jgi:hypothetical protein
MAQKKHEYTDDKIKTLTAELAFVESIAHDGEYQCRLCSYG